MDWSKPNKQNCILDYFDKIWSEIFQHDLHNVNLFMDSYLDLVNLFMDSYLDHMNDILDMHIIRKLIINN